MTEEAEFGHNSGEEEMTTERAIEAALEEIERIEYEQAEIDKINEQAKQDKAPHRDEIAALRKKCRDDYSIEAKALSTILTKRRNERRMQERIAKLEGAAKDQMDLFIQMSGE